MIDPDKNSLEYVTFQIEGWNGAAIAPSAKHIPLWLNFEMQGEFSDAMDSLAEWLYEQMGNEIGADLKKGDSDQLVNFIYAWLDASGIDIDQFLGITNPNVNADVAGELEDSEYDPGNPYQIEQGSRGAIAGNKKYGMTIRELANFVADSEHLIDHPVEVETSWFGNKLHRITVD